MEKALDIFEKSLKKVKKSKQFSVLLVEAQKAIGRDFTKGEVSKIFTNINLDARFVHLGQNKWDLRIKHPYAKVHTNLSQLYTSANVAIETTAEIVENDVEFDKDE